MVLKRKNVFNLSRYQFLTMTELELGKNKNALIAAMSKNYTCLLYTSDAADE